jgi:hypothetical protein
MRELFIDFSINMINLGRLKLHLLIPHREFDGQRSSMLQGEAFLY